jgi:hypothetical protein
MGLNGGGNSTCFASQNAPASTVTITTGNTTIVEGGSTTLTWNGGVGSCTASALPASGSWSGAKATSGSGVTVSPTITTTYTITCDYGSASIIVKVNKKPKIIEN